MKKILFLILVVLVISSSCSDDFLDNNERELTMISGTAVFSSRNPAPEIEINLGVAGSEKFHITYFPKWIEWESMHGRFQNGVATLKFSVRKSETEPDSDLLAGIVILDIERIGLVGVEVIYGNIGNIPGDTHNRIIALNGSVKDAVMHQSTGTMVLATQYPNQLLVYRPEKAELFTISINDTPQCLDFLDDGKAVLVGGASAVVSLVNLDSRSVVQEYPLDCAVFDLVAGQNGWCYISPQGESWDVLRSLNLTTGEVVLGGQEMRDYFYGNVILKKIAGRSELMGTRTQIGPSGLIQINIEEGAANDKISYRHMDINDFWPFRDGNKFLTRSGEIFPVPAFSPNGGFLPNLNEIGRLNLSGSEIRDACFTASGNTLFVALPGSWQPGGNQIGNNIIREYDALTLSPQNSFNPSYSLLNYHGEMIIAHYNVRYVFTNEDGSRLWAVRQLAPDFGREEWNIEEFVVR